MSNDLNLQMMGQKKWSAAVLALAATCLVATTGTAQSVGDDTEAPSHSKTPAESTTGWFHSLTSTASSFNPLGDDNASPEPEEVQRAIDAAVARVHGSHDETSERTVAWQTLPAQPTGMELTDPDLPASESVSIGDPSDGRLHHAAELPVEGQHHAIIDKHRPRDTNYGTTELVDLLRHAAADVADRHPGSTLKIGNLSRQSGGDIRWSGSHNSGRDADVAFFANSRETERDIATPGLIHFGKDGLGESGRLQFDVARNWTLVRSLLTHERTDLQWLFISQPLKAKLLARAHRLGEPEWLIERARSVLHQPTAAPPHGDHLHIRIACPATDRILGCREYGPQWSWASTHRRPLLARTLAISREITRTIEDGRFGDDLDAYLETLKELGSPFTTEIALRQARRLVEDPPARSTDRHRATYHRMIELAAEHGAVSTTALIQVRQLLHRSPALDGPKTREQLYAILKRALLQNPAPGPNAPEMATQMLVVQLTDPLMPASERALAARIIQHRPTKKLVPLLLDEVRRQPEPVQSAVKETLKIWTGVGAGDPVAWRNWWRRARNATRAQWLRDAFEDRGYTADITALDESTGDELLDALTGDHSTWFRTIAARQMERLTDRRLPLSWSLDRRAAYWKEWWPNNRARRFGESAAATMLDALPDLRPPPARRAEQIGQQNGLDQRSLSPRDPSSASVSP